MILPISQCPEVNCNETYIGETARRLQERVLDHAGKDRISNMVKHSMDTSHLPVCIKIYSIAHKKTSVNTKRSRALRNA